MRELQKLLVKGTKSDNPQAWDIRSTQVFIGPPTRRIEDARFAPMPPGRIGRLLVLLQMMSRGLLRVKRLVNVRQRYRSLLDEHRYSGLSVQTAMYLIGQPTVTASMLKRRFGKSPSAVQHALSRLVSVGILRAYPAGRGNLYIAPDIHKVLAAPLGAAIDVSAPLMCERGE